MKGVRQAKDPLVYFGAKPEKGFGLEISKRPEVGKVTPVRELEQGTQREWVGGGRGRRALGSRDRTAEETSWHERESSISEGIPVKMSQHSLSFVEISRRVHVSVSLHMQRIAVCHNLTFLHLS